MEIHINEGRALYIAKALASPTRLLICEECSCWRTYQYLQEHCDLALSTLSNHIQKLILCGILEERHNYETGLTEFKTAVKLLQIHFS